MSKELIERLRNEDLFTSLFGSLAALHECNEELKNEAAYAIEALTAECARLREAIKSVLKGALMADGINRDGTGLTFEISMGDFDPSTKKMLLSIEKKLQEALS